MLPLSSTGKLTLKRLADPLNEKVLNRSIQGWAIRTFLEGL